LVAAAKHATAAIEQLVAKARAAAVPVISANDNFGQWRSDFETTVQACLAPDKPGREVTARLRPQPGDYFVLKPKTFRILRHSARVGFEGVGCRHVDPCWLRDGSVRAVYGACARRCTVRQAHRPRWNSAITSE
jgi:Isochorismatase family